MLPVPQDTKARKRDKEREKIYCPGLRIVFITSVEAGPIDRASIIKHT